MADPRDYSAMYDGVWFCVVCDRLLTTVEACDPNTHVNSHLAAGEAIVLKVFGQPDRILPTSSIPDDAPRAAARAQTPVPGPVRQSTKGPALPLTPARIARLTRKHLRAFRGASYRPKGD